MGDAQLMVLLTSGGGPGEDSVQVGRAAATPPRGAFSARDLLSLSCQRTINFPSKYKT